MFHFKKKENMEVKIYSPEKYKPVIKCSICTGEMAAGFKDLASGKFEEVMLIRGEGDLEEFKMRYGLSEVSKEY